MIEQLTLRQRIDEIRLLLRSVLTDEAAGRFMRNIAQEQLKMWADIAEIWDMEHKDATPN